MPTCTPSTATQGFSVITTDLILNGMFQEMGDHWKETVSSKVIYFYFLKTLFIYLFLERGERREKERERHQCVVTSHMHTLLGTWPATQSWALTGNRTGDPLVGSPALNPLSQSSHGKSYFFYLTYFYYKICMDMI